MFEPSVRVECSGRATSCASAARCRVAMSVPCVSICTIEVIVLVVEGSTVMPAWPGVIQAVTLFVEDLAKAKEFYQDVFELPVHFEDENSAVFRFGATMVNLLAVASAPELVAPAP